MKKIVPIIFKILCLSVIFSGACRNEKIVPVPCDTPVSTETISYNLDVYPIISSNCTLANCHVTGFEKGDFTNFDEIKQKAESGMLKYMIVTQQMPHGDTKGQRYLTDCEKTKILTWIDGGSKNN
jgi:hypothetical protein